MPLKNIQLAAISPQDPDRRLYEVTLHSDDGHQQACIDVVGEHSAVALRNALREHADRLRVVFDHRPSRTKPEPLVDAVRHTREQLLIDALRVLARYPLEQFNMHHDTTPDSKPLFGACDWTLTVGDVRKARDFLGMFGVTD